MQTPNTNGNNKKEEEQSTKINWFLVVVIAVPFLVVMGIVIAGVIYWQHQAAITRMEAILKNKDELLLVFKEWQHVEKKVGEWRNHPKDEKSTHRYFKGRLDRILRIDSRR
tara:strand:+ start:74 stop:406 length:333 start_codon:yes stop_codon:yes gene_type:complete